MQVLRAEELGMCFGVRDALRAIEQLPEPEEVTIHGELVHNVEVLADLDRRGFRRSPEGDRRVPATPVVLVTAHGVSDAERRRLVAAGKQIVDTTCPLVRRAHAAARTLEDEGRRVVVIGRRDHVEVRGIIGDLRDALVVGSEADVACWPEPALGVVCQTTTQVDEAARLLEAIRRRNPHADVRFVDTICQPTKARVEALAALLPRIDGLVVVGGRNSNNTLQLVRAAEQLGVRCWHVQNAAELRAAWFAGHRCLGLTAGTSTLASTVDDVHRALVSIAAP